MTMALRRTAMMALKNRNGKLFSFVKPFVSCRYPSSALTASSPGECASAAADQLLLEYEAVSDVASQVEMIPDLLRPRVVVYDGVCHLCHAGVKWIIRTDRDRKIKFCCLQSKAAEPYMSVSGLNREDILRRFLFVEGPGLYHQGSAAPLRDAVYDYVAKQRYDWFGKDDDCLVLKEIELLERFVDWEELLERNRQKHL